MRRWATIILHSFRLFCGDLQQQKWLYTSSCNKKKKLEQNHTARKRGFCLLSISLNDRQGLRRPSQKLILIFSRYPSCSAHGTCKLSAQQRFIQLPIPHKEQFSFWAMSRIPNSSLNYIWVMWNGLFSSITDNKAFVPSVNQRNSVCILRTLLPQKNF